MAATAREATTDGPGGLATGSAITEAQDGSSETAMDKSLRAADWLLQVERDDIIKYLPSKNQPRFASTKQKGDPQRSARIACKIMQKDSGPENPKWATPHVTHANTGTPLAALA